MLAYQVHGVAKAGSVATPNPKFSPFPPLREPVTYVYTSHMVI